MSDGFDLCVTVDLVETSPDALEEFRRRLSSELGNGARLVDHSRPTCSLEPTSHVEKVFRIVGSGDRFTVEEMVNRLVEDVGVSLVEK